MKVENLRLATLLLEITKHCIATSILLNNTELSIFLIQRAYTLKNYDTYYRSARVRV